MKSVVPKHRKLAYALITISFLVSCRTPAEVSQGGITPFIPSKTNFSPTSTILPILTATLTASPSKTLTPKPTASLTPMTPIPVKTGPLTLDITNVGTQLQRLARLGYGHAEDVEFSPDGKYLAVGTGAGIVLYNAKTFEQVRVIETNEPVTHMAFSPDGSLVAVGIDYHEISLWGVESGQMIMEIAASIESGFSSLLYSNGDFIAVSGGSLWGVKWFEVWSASTGKPILSKSINFSSFLSLDISPDGKILYYGTDVEGGILMDINSRNIIDHIPAYPNVIFSPDGNSLFMATSENSLAYVWDIRTRQSNYLAELANCGFFSRNGNHVICNNVNDNSILVLDPTTGSILKKISPDIAFDVTISADGQYVAYSNNNAVDVFDASTDKIIFTLPFETTTSLAVGHVQISGVERYLAATGTLDGLISLWNLSTGEKINSLTQNGNVIRALAFGPDQRTLASLDNGGQIQLWDLQELKAIALYEIGSSGFNGWKISFGDRGQKLLLIGQQAGFSLDIQSGKFTDLPSDFYAVSYSSGDIYQISHYIENVFDEHRISIKRIDQSNHIEFNIPPSKVVSLLDDLAISPDARFLAAGFGSSPIYIVDLQNGELFNSLSGHAPGMCHGDCGYVETYESILFSPQNNLLLSIGQDKTTRLWNIQGTTQLRQLNTCCLAAFSPDGRLLVTAGDELVNNPIEVWGIPPLP